jgi:hypothetical protein
VSNGTAGTVAFLANVSLFQVHNETVWGPGQNVHCTSPYAVIRLPPPANGAISSVIPTPSRLSDVNESDNVSILHTPSNLSTVFYFDNGFSSPNMAPVTTCGAAGENLSSTSTRLSAGVPFNISGHVVVTPLTLNFAQKFWYDFPPNFGTWQIDNLSEPGGPGGGWAFSYAPCS